MNYNKYSRIVLLILILLMGAGIISQAEETDAAPRIIYYVQADDAGIQQVYQLLLDGESSPRQLTHSGTDVITFAAAYDGLSVAYVSDGQLWLQPIHTEEAEALVSISADRITGEPVYSPDNQYIAYSDNGIWLLDLSNRETQQLLEDVALAADGSNMGDLSVYQPDRFLLDSNGLATQLLLKIGIWEWRTSGIYDLATGELTVLEGHIHTDILPLADGTVLVYGNNGVDGEASLSLADNLETLNTFETVLEFAELTDTTLFAEQAIEIAPGIVRVSGTALQPPSFPNFYFDYDVASDAASEIQFINMPASTTGSTIAVELSPDAIVLPVYVDALWTDEGSIYGALQLQNIVTGEIVYAIPGTASIFNWQQ